MHKITEFVDEAVKYIKTIRTENRPTGFVGFVIGLVNTINLFKEYCPKKIKYLPMYKISQDHIELFFSSIRSRLGSNNNPTPRQFTAAYKKLLIRTELREGGKWQLCTIGTNSYFDI